MWCFQCFMGTHLPKVGRKSLKMSYDFINKIARYLKMIIIAIESKWWIFHFNRLMEKAIMCNICVNGCAYLRTFWVTRPCLSIQLCMWCLGSLALAHNLHIALFTCSWQIETEFGRVVASYVQSLNTYMIVIFQTYL